MNPALIHLASIECWQRARQLKLPSSAFFILQALAATTRGMRRVTIMDTVLLKQTAAESNLQLLKKKGLIAAANRPQPNAYHSMVYSLTEQGRTLMVPQARASQASNERSAV